MFVQECLYVFRIVGKSIGSGNFGEVRLGMHVKTKKKYIFKVVK